MRWGRAEGLEGAGKGGGWRREGWRERGVGGGGGRWGGLPTPFK